MEPGSVSLVEILSGVLFVFIAFTLNYFRVRLKECMTKESCGLKHKLADSEMENIKKATEKAEAQNTKEHDELKTQLSDIYGSLDDIRKCVFELSAKYVDK